MLSAKLELKPEDAVARVLGCRRARGSFDDPFEGGASGSDIVGVLDLEVGEEV